MFLCLTSIMPDETLYSWCSANHVLSCQRNSEATGAAFFHAKHAARQHEFPQSMEVFVRAAQRTEDSLTEILRSHTVAGFYLPFLSRQEQTEIAAKGLQQESPHWNRRLIGSSRTLKIVHPLKWCRSCVNDDISKVGRAYWHTSHQFPITVFCEKHDKPLELSNIRSKKWRLPSQSTGFSFDLSPHAVRAAQHVASVSAALRGIQSIDMGAVRLSTLLRLKEMGVIHSVDGARHERLTRWFCSTGSSALARIAQPQMTQSIEASPIPSLLWRRKRDTAIPWVLLWCALDWASSTDAAQTFVLVASGSGPVVGGQLPLFANLGEHPQSAPEHVRRAFMACISYAEVMSKLSVSRADIVRWLEVDPELRRAWRFRLREGRENECVERITAFVNNSPKCSLADIERNSSADLRWLREHSPRRLAQLLGSIPTRHPRQFQLFN